MMTEDHPSLPESGRPPAHPAHPVPAEPAASGASPSTVFDPGGGDFEEEGIDLRRYLAALYRYKWLILLTTAVGLAAGLVVAKYFVELEYEAQTTLWVEQQPERRGGGGARGPIRSEELLGSAGWIELLRSYTVLDPVVEQERLYVRYGAPKDSTVMASFSIAERFRPGKYRLATSEDGAAYTLATKDGLVVERGEVGDSIGTDLGFRWSPDADELTPGRTVEFQVVTPRDAGGQLAQRLRTNLAQNFLRIRLRGSNPDRIASILNSVAEEHVSVAAELKRAKLEELQTILKEQLDYAEENLREAERELESFRVETITLPSERSTPVAPGLQMTQGPVISNFFDMKIELEDLRRDRARLEEMLEQRPDSGLSVAALEAIPSVGRSSQLSGALQELSTKRAELRALRYRYTEQHPPVQELGAEIRKLEQETVPSLIRNVIADLEDREDELSRLVEDASSELSSIPPRSIEEARLRRRVDIAETLYTTLQNRYEEARLAAVSSIPDIRVLDEAVAPRVPVNDQRPRMVVLFLVAGLGLGVGGAVLLDRFDPSVRYPDQVSEEIGLPILGMLPEIPSGNGRKGDEGNRNALEAFRELRLNLTHAYGTAGPIVLTVTSPGSGDGKSFVTSNLAVAYGELGFKTLIIDADLRRGDLHRFLGVGGDGPGLTDFLAEERAPDAEIVQPTDHENVHFLGCGTRRSGAPELLGTPLMRQLLVGARSRYEAILVDSPPLGAGADAFLLSTLTGNAVVVLRANATNREYTEAKLDPFSRLPVRLLGAVLNDVSLGGGYGRYYYRYYSYLPEYAEDPEEVGTRLVRRT